MEKWDLCPSPSHTKQCIFVDLIKPIGQHSYDVTRQRRSAAAFVIEKRNKQDALPKKNQQPKMIRQNLAPLLYFMLFYIYIYIN